MEYTSTRNDEIKVTSAKAIAQGISDDGGLFVPCELPSITLADIKTLSEKSYPEIANYVLSQYLTDFSEAEIHYCTNGAYESGNFETENVIELASLFDKDFGCYMLELWHGPTCAFKDMALQILPYLLTTSIKKQNIDKKVVILVATSGDTGKAALEGFKDVSGTDILVFYPVDGVSNMQKRQMITQEGDNVGVCAIKGNFDDAQTGVKKIFTDAEIKATLSENGYLFSSANSINWGRLLPQIVYYIASYAKLVKNEEIALGDKINICVPTGNFGNILAAYYAKHMGLPVNKLICASNSNNVLTDFLTDGVYDRNRRFYTTISPSMDILISSNLERLLYDLSGKNDEYIRTIYKSLAETGRFEVSEEIKSKLNAEFSGGFATEEETKLAISEAEKTYGYVMDTHTAVAYSVYKKYAEATGDRTKTVIASTANPYKFPAAVLEALGCEKIPSDDFELLDALHDASGMSIPASLGALKTKAPRFEGSVSKDEMLGFIYTALNVK